MRYIHEAHTKESMWNQGIFGAPFIVSMDDHNVMRQIY